MMNDEKYSTVLIDVQFIFDIDKTDNKVMQGYFKFSEDITSRWLPYSSFEESIEHFVLTPTQETKNG